MKKLNLIPFVIVLAMPTVAYAKSTNTTTTTIPIKKDWVLPNAKITPGALNPDVNQSNIKDNICKTGWTDTVRPTVSYTNKLKTTQLANDYKGLTNVFGVSLSGYEEDHLISLQLGGSPTDIKNLWPQPYDGNNARKKDVVETKLKKLVCTGTITLSVAQKAIATNWLIAYNQYVTPKDATSVESNG
jgi:hypothetical protein